MTYLLCDSNYKNLIGVEDIYDYVLAEADNLINLQKRYTEIEKNFNSFGLPLDNICIIERWEEHELKKN